MFNCVRFFRSLAKAYSVYATHYLKKNHLNMYHPSFKVIGYFIKQNFVCEFSMYNLEWRFRMFACRALCILYWHLIIRLARMSLNWPNKCWAKKITSEERKENELAFDEWNERFVNKCCCQICTSIGQRRENLIYSLYVRFNYSIYFRTNFHYDTSNWNTCKNMKDEK